MKLSSLKSPRGFTLVELLVVIGIIAVLISLLLPALSKARESAGIVACSAQMRQIAIAARGYASENKDQLPPTNGDVDSLYYHVFQTAIDAPGTAVNGVVNSRGGYSVVFARSVFFPYWINAQTGNEYTDLPLKKGIGAGIGRLYQTGFLKGAFYKVIQCPSAYVGESRDDQRNFGFNPQYAIRTLPGGQQAQEPWWRKMAQYGRGLRGTYKAKKMFDGTTNAAYSFAQRRFSLVTDAINFPDVGGTFGVVSHQSKNNYAVNLAFSDGSVQTAYLSKRINRQGNNLTRFSDTLGYLEMSLSGNGTGSNWTAGNYGYLPIDP